MTMISRLTRPFTKPLKGLLASNSSQITQASTPAVSALQQTRLSPRLVIPTCDKSREEKEQTWHHSQGLHLARQEKWDDLSYLLRQFDSLRAATPGGTPIPSLLAQGARADTVTPALPHGAPIKVARRLGVAALDEIATERKDDYTTSLIAALSHIDIGWSFRGDGWTSEMAARDHEAFVHHFDRANALLDGFDPIEQDSPALAAARCAALPGAQSPSDAVTATYETLVTLDPTAPGHMRALGNHLLPRWFGSYERLNLEARRTATRTENVWGNGGYAWVYMDALLVDERAYEMLDTDFFLDGVRDILSKRPDQHLANLFAAYLGVSTRTGTPKCGDERQIERARARLTAGFRWVLHDFLREVHPLLWAEAADRFIPDAVLPDRAALVRRGRAAAFSRISEVFAHVMSDGQIVRFDPDGIVFSPSA